MSEPLIDDETYAELRELEQSGLNQTATITRDGAPIASRVPFTVQPAAINASGFRMQPAIAGLGSGRAALIGFVPWGTDVLEGDTITSAGHTYAVDGVGALDTSVGLALNEVRA